jgi:hypothetical protein
LVIGVLGSSQSSQGCGKSKIADFQLEVTLTGFAGVGKWLQCLLLFEYLNEMVRAETVEESKDAEMLRQAAGLLPILT